MDFINLAWVVSATLFPLCVNLTVGYNYEDLRSYGILQEQEEIEKKRFLVTNPIVAGWNPWSPWSVCSSSCREGVQARGRGCNTRVTSDCPGQNYDVTVCNLGPCSVWNPWSPWSVCSRTCGDGLRARGRSCESGVLSDCDGPHYEKDNCTLKSCSAWVPWSSWSVCSHSCGGGFQTRDRTCNTGVNSDCEGHSYDIQECNVVPCDGISSTPNPASPSGHTRVDGKWSDWSTYSSCSVSCGIGTHTRSRSCLFNDPAALHGAECFGANSTMEPCNPGPCPVDGTWSSWTNFTACSKTCGGGIQFRSRHCVFLNGYPHGRDCNGTNSSSQECHKDLCPVNGSWAEWSAWSGCIVTCGNGTEHRARKCQYDSRAPQGEPCHGQYSDSKECFQGLCPMDGAWKHWSSWSICGSTCGGGVRTRNRTCEYKADVPIGLPCLGNNSQNQACADNLCPVDGVWSSWSTLTVCTQTCGNGTQHRERTCIFLNTGATHGKNCSGNSSQTITCNPSLCPVDGHWNAWSAWSTCSHTCGFAVQHRQRTCIFPEPRARGNDCVGNFQETKDCALKLCPVNGTWTDWNAWSSCSQTCDNGTMTRKRTCQFLPAGAPLVNNCTGDFQEKKPCMFQPCPASTKSNFTCATCGEYTPDLCEVIYEQSTVCPNPYCINIIRNPDSGQRLVERKCGTLQECKEDWWQQTSQIEKCTLFNENYVYTQWFECTYCCTTANCNEYIHPQASTLYWEK